MFICTRILALAAMCLVLASCATVVPPLNCPEGRQNLPDCPPASAIDDPEINQLYQDRTWLPSGEIEKNLIELGKQAEIPVQHARTRFLGPDKHAALDSLAVKLWMIENAEHTIDFTYYIFNNDLVGYSMLAAMCNAVRRGVDVRVTIDSIGSASGGAHPALRALVTCGEKAGFMRNSEGRLTTKKARVQVVIFNAVSTLGNPNRRSHDKLLVMDGNFEDNSAVITGGRNISVHYYGIHDDGTPDPQAFRDAELLIRSNDTVVEEDLTVGELSESYASLLFLLDFNKRVLPGNTERERTQYALELKKAEEALQRLKGNSYFSPHMAEMDDFMNTGFHDSQVRLAHELGNLTDKRVVARADDNQQKNPNSIMELLQRLGDEAPELRSVRLVSPYLFLAEYRNSKGELINDEAEGFRQWLADHPDASLEIITNSVLTSDNFPAQSVIDMNTAPRLLLPPEVREEWLNLDTENEIHSELVNSDTWHELVNHPRLKVYEIGRLDSAQLGDGDQNYGKLHAKFFLSGDVGFIGTSNFDYRSRLYNNEMGFFFHDPDLAADVHESFDELKSISYRWGSPEWLQLRKAVMEMGGVKGQSTKRQRGLYRVLKSTGVIWWL